MRFFVFLAALLLALSGCEKTAPAAAPPLFARTVKPENGEFQFSYRFLGQVKPYRQADIVSRISGVLEERCFTEGAFVAANDLLYRMEKDTYVLARKHAEAVLAQARAEQKNAQLELHRSETLLSEDAAARKRFDSSVAAARSADARVAAAEAELEQAKLNCSYTEIRAPFSGWIGFTAADAGTYLSAPSRTLATVSEIDPVRVQFEVSDRYLSGRLLQSLFDPDAPRWTLKLTLPDGTNFDAPVELKFWNNALERNSATLALQAVARNPAHRLLPGMFCSVTLTDPEARRVLFLDERAIRHEQSETFVYVLSASGVVQFRRVEIGESRSGRVVVHSGLNAGEVVVLPGNPRILPGSKPEIRP